LRMNPQRWIALALLASIIACIATSSIWIGILFGGEDETAEDTSTPTPQLEQVADAEEETEPEQLIPSGNLTPTVDPVLEELLEELNVESLGAGDEPFIVRAGDFTTIDAIHRGEGTANVYRVDETRFVLRLEPFSVTSGPDLHVLLSENETPRTSADALLPTHVDLGPLEAPEGAQNYAIAETINLSQYESVVIYSMSLNIVYTSADIQTVRGADS